MSPTIHTLPHLAESGDLRLDIEAGLKGHAEYIVPGSSREDRQWAFRRSVPTMVLYDEQGLKLYDRITAQAPEYYPFEDELNLLKVHGEEIARCMGFPGKAPPEQKYKSLFVPEKPWRPARWGDSVLGRWNNGVNGEEGLGGGWETGWDVVELGAGALRKTAHLLTALSASLPPAPANAASLASPITYHALDLSHPELSRVLGEMDDQFGPQLAGKVDCVGLHGDYFAGLQFVRDGKLAELRADALPSPPLTRAESSLDSPPPMTPSTAADDLPASEMDPLSPPASATLAAQAEDKVCGTVPAAPLATLSLSGGDATPAAKDRPLHIMFLGSSLGNFAREDAAPFLASLPLRKGDTLLLGLDGRPAAGYDGVRKVEVAYNDPAGHTKAFEEHGWEVVRRELGLKGDAGVEFVGRYNEILGRHEAYFRCKDQQTIHLPVSNADITLEKDELLNIEWSYKYSYLEALHLFDTSNLRVIQSWKAPGSEYRLWLLERPEMNLFNTPDMQAQAKTVAVPGALDRHRGVPNMSEWEAMWSIWDHITLKMISPEKLHSKPIDLRHICLFYLGHIPTFLDIHLTRLTKGKHTEPEKFKDIFERGIDPDVDDPTKIHSHSEVPTREDEWPVLEEIIGFRDRVRARLRSIYADLESGCMPFTRHTGRVLFMTFEHEAMHAETLLYMLLQSPHTLPPTATSPPQWNVLAKAWQEAKSENKVLSLEAGPVQIGHHDLESEDAKFTTGQGWENHEFGWDNEHPQVLANVEAFKVDSLPISNADYMEYLKSTNDGVNGATAPASWVQPQGAQGGEWYVRTLYGPVSFEVAGLWPLMASKIEIERFCAWKGGRLPTEQELQRLWSHPSGPRPAGPTTNVAFRHWHLIPPTNTTVDTTGEPIYGHNGGLWEWTSTLWESSEGYVPSKIYPGYSADFLDGKHYVVLGGSYATVPALANRKSFKNWYQGNYPYAWITGRVVYDA